MAVRSPVVLVVAGLLALTGCGDSGPTTAAATTSSAAAGATTSGIAAGTVVVDVRTPEEFAAGHLEGAVNIDASADDFATRIAELDQAGSYVVYCRTGSRSAAAATLMTEQGFTRVTDAGGYEQAATDLGLPIVTG